MTFYAIQVKNWTRNVKYDDKQNDLKLRSKNMRPCTPFVFY